MKRYFVTGTDTGVGKTYVTAQLARRARSRAPTAKVFAYKPIETGCGTGFGEDQLELARAAGGWQQGPLCGLYQLRLPAAPLVAAKAESRSIDLDDVRCQLAIGSEGASLTLVEGAGGWRVPITPTADMASMARDLAFPVIVVARAGLGTINHSLLTLEAVERDGCTIAALVLSQRAGDDPRATQSNVEQIQARWPGQILVLAADAASLDSLL